MKNILVTGGAGFIGSNLCKRLVNEGNKVISLDNYYTGRSENLEPLKGNANFQELKGDVCDKVDLEFDQVYHLACPASPVHYQADPISTIKTNVYGTMNLLEAAEKNKARLFMASTSEVYGDPDMHPQREEYWGNVNPVGVRSCYDEGKRISETCCMEFKRDRGLSVGIVRIFNTYGPAMRADDGRVVSNFIVQALGGDDLTIFGDGTQTRSFCYVDDLVEGFVRMMNSDHTGPVNLGNPGEFTMLELAEKVLKKTGSASRLVKRPLPEDDPKKRKPDITLAGKLLDWQPGVSLDEGLDRTIEYFRTQIS